MALNASSARALLSWYLNAGVDELVQDEAVDRRRSSPPPRPATPVQAAATGSRLQPPGQRIAIARDEAFAFIYPHLVRDWRKAGAEIAFFSPLANETPHSESDAIYLPGGYPELHAGRLAGNAAFLDGLRAAMRRDALIYGECGGFMTLGQGLIDAEGVRHQMAGLLNLETSFEVRRRHLGYRRLSPSGGPWRAPLAAHEFHYSTVISSEGNPLFSAQDAAGNPLPDMGLIEGKVMGSYAHIIDISAH